MCPCICPIILFIHFVLMLLIYDIDVILYITFLNTVNVHIMYLVCNYRLIYGPFCVSPAHGFE